MYEALENGNITADEYLTQVDTFSYIWSVCRGVTDARLYNIKFTEAPTAHSIYALLFRFDVGGK